MIRRLLKEESGYSLVEVIVSIFILTAAIIPMVGMFDMGLKAATRGGNYDQARALADTTLEKVRALPFADASATYGPAAPATTPTRSVSCTSPSPSPYTCNMTTSYLSPGLTEANEVTTKMQVVVRVQWAGGSSYTITGLTAK